MIQRNTLLSDDGTLWLSVLRQRLRGNDMFTFVALTCSLRVQIHRTVHVPAVLKSMLQAISKTRLVGPPIFHDFCWSLEQAAHQPLQEQPRTDEDSEDEGFDDSAATPDASATRSLPSSPSSSTASVSSAVDVKRDSAPAASTLVDGKQNQPTSPVAAASPSAASAANAKDKAADAKDGAREPLLFSQ